MRVCVLGPIEIQSAEGFVCRPNGGKQRLLLAMLTMHAPRVVSSDRLIDVLWADQLPEDPSAALRTQLSRLRALLRRAGAGDRLKHSDTPGYALDLAAEDVDAGVFAQLHGSSRRNIPPEQALAFTEQALALWRDEPYSEVRDNSYFVGETNRLRELWLSAQERRVQCLLTLGRSEEALTGATALAAADPLRESSRALMMQALYRNGRQADALANFQEYRRLLAEELGLSPSPALRALETEILQHLPARAVPPAATAAAVHSVVVPAEAQPAELSQHIRFATSRDGVRLAYATVGSGAPLVKAANWLNHLEFDWQSPVWRRLFREIAARHTFIRYDERACGLSDQHPPEMSLDAWVLDLECVVDACGLERFPLLGISQGCAVSIEYAARHPDRVSGLILHGGYAAGWRADPSFGPAEIARRDASIDIVRHGWGEDTPAYRQMFTQTFIPGGTAAEIAWFNELQRRTVTPENAARFMETFAWIDVRHRLSAVQAPTLVLHSRGDQRIHYDKGRELAAGIPNARFVLLESENHLILEHEPAFDTWTAETFQFLAREVTGIRAP